MHVFVCNDAQVTFFLQISNDKGHDGDHRYPMCYEIIETEDR